MQQRWNAWVRSFYQVSNAMGQPESFLQELNRQLFAVRGTSVLRQLISLCMAGAPLSDVAPGSGSCKGC
jgi:hypothetical protein